MTSRTNPSTMLTDALAQFSKAAYNAFTEMESRSSNETRKAHEETREARDLCEKLRRDLHSATVETQGWKQEAVEAKASLAQAELKIAHQTELHNEAIVQLRREVNQLKDQSRNWQKHFLRVEQERCAQSSRIDELLTLQVSSYTGSCTHASPLPDKAWQMNHSMPLKRRRDIPRVNSSEERPQPPIGERQWIPSSSKQKNKGNDPNIAISSGSHRRDPQNATPHTTLIRRVQAVVRIKREESDDDFAKDVSAAGKDEASDEDEVSRAIQRRPSRRSLENFIVDDEENPVRESMSLRHRNGTINYREEDEDEDDVDELMIGAEGDEILGAQLSKPSSPRTPKKRRKLTQR